MVAKKTTSRKSISITKEYYEKLVEIRDNIPTTGKRKVSWNETFDHIFAKLDDIENVKKDVERLRKLIEDIAVSPKVTVHQNQPTQMYPAQEMSGYPAPTKQPVFNLPAALNAPPPPPPASSFQKPEESIQFSSKPKRDAMSIDEFMKPPPSGNKGLPVIKEGEGKTKENHANLMKEMKALFRSGKKILKKTDEEIKKEEEAKTQEEKDLAKAEQEAIQFAAQTVVDNYLNEVGIELDSILPNTKNLMITMYSKLQEEKQVDKYRHLIEASIGDLFELIAQGNDELLSEVSDLLAYVKQDPDPLIKELKELRETLPERFPKIDLPRLMKIKEIVNDLSKKLGNK